MIKHSYINVDMFGSDECLENNLDMIVSAIDRTGLVECDIRILNFGEVKEDDA